MVQKLDYLFYLKQIQMARPIFLLGIPSNFSGEEFEKICKSAEGMSDYLVVAYHNNSKEYSFRVIAENDYEVIELEKLKNELRELAKSNS